CDSDSTSSMAARSGAIVFWRRYYNRHEGMGQPSHQPVVTQCARGITVHDDAAHDVDRLAGRHPGHMRPSQRRSVGTTWSRRVVAGAEPYASLEELRDERRQHAGMGWATGRRDQGPVVSLAGVQERVDLRARLIDGPRPGHTERTRDARHAAGPVLEDLVVGD